MVESVLGFQLKCSIHKIEAWDDDRREKYLIENCLTPLSVDGTVWPLSSTSIKKEEIFSDYSGRIFSAPNGLSLYTLRFFPIPSAIDLNEDMLVAITTNAAHANSIRRLRFISKTNLTTHHLESEKWKNLGFDVADYWLTSGLMNFGFPSIVKEKIRKKFESKFNQNGLFYSLKDAENFCTDCEDNFPNHAPFAPFGIWSIY